MTDAAAAVADTTTSAGAAALATDAGAAANGAANGAAAAEVPAPIEWLGKDVPPEIDSLVRTKAWANPRDAVTAYASLEKLIGTERLAIPKDASDTANWDKVYNRLGRPEKPDGYKIAMPTSYSVPDPKDATKTIEVPINIGGTGFADKFAAQAHRLGLSKAQAEGLAQWWNSAGVENLKQMHMTGQRDSTAALNALKAEKGATWPDFEKNARLVVTQFGVTQEELVAVENAMGTAKFVALFGRVGAGMREHGVVDGGAASGGFKMTPAAALQRIADLRADKAWVTKYTAGDADAKAEFKRLHEFAHGTSPIA